MVLNGDMCSMLKQTDIKNVLRIVTIHFPLFIFNASARMRPVNASAKMRGRVHHLQYALALVKKLKITICRLIHRYD